MEGIELISTSNSEYGDWSWDSETLTKANNFHINLLLLNFLFHSALQCEYLVVFDMHQSTFMRNHDVISAYEHISDKKLELER